MGQETVLTVVEAFRASRDLSREDKEQLTNTQKMASMGQEAGLAAAGKEFTQTVVRESLARDTAAAPKVEKTRVTKATTSLLKDWGKSTVQQRMIDEGGGFAYIAWAWKTADVARKLVSTEHPAFKVLEVGLFFNDVVLAAQKSYLDEQLAAKAAEIDWVWKAHSDATDRLVSQGCFVAKECESAGMKVVPKWKLDDPKSFVQRMISAVNDVTSGDGERGKMFVQGQLRINFLDDLAYLHDLRAGAYSLGAASDAWSSYLEMLVDNPNNKSILPAAFRDYQGLVISERSDLFQMYTKDVRQLACDLRAAADRVLNVESNLWHLLGPKLGFSSSLPQLEKGR